MKPASGRPPKKPSGKRKPQPHGDHRGSRRNAEEEQKRGWASSAGKIAVILVFAGGSGIVALNAFRGQTKVDVAVVEPARLSPLAVEGKGLFEAKCALCHGPKADGTDRGPPFVSDIYNPGHHADEAFVLAARFGVRAHHWRFGNMPPVQNVTDAEVAAIIRYVRELQEANGIRYQSHTM